MVSKYLPVFIVGLSVALSGCYFADGAAQLAKMAGEKHQKDSADQQPAAETSAPVSDSASASAPAPAETKAEEPPPVQIQPQASPSSTAVEVETLPPP